MIYDGVLSELLGIEMAEMEKALRKQFGKKVKAAELNLGGAAGRIRLRGRTPAQRGSFPPRADGQDARHDPDRRKCLRRARRHARRRHRRRLVSDHAVIVAARDADRLSAQVPHRQNDGEGDVRGRAGRGRDRGDRDGRGRRMGRRPCDDVDIRAGHLADGGVRRPGVLRRGPGRRVRRPARRARRPACRRGPRRATSCPRRCCRTATRSRCC